MFNAQWFFRSSRRMFININWDQWRHRKAYYAALRAPTAVNPYYLKVLQKQADMDADSLVTFKPSRALYLCHFQVFDFKTIDSEPDTYSRDDYCALK